MSSKWNKNADATTGELKEADTERTNEEKKLVSAFVQKTLEKGPNGLRAEFNGMKRGNDLSKMTAFVENIPKGKNRYKDVGCLDVSRVMLRDFPGGDYIHGNYVETPVSKDRFICTQAPIEKTCPEFWAMIVQEKVENILMLGNVVENGVKKGHEYFVSKEKKQLTFGEYKITFVSQKSLKFTCETQAQIMETVMECKFKGKKQKTSHYQWVDWNDRGIPPADMAVIQLLEKVQSTRHPIVVHGTAGIGRTGCIVLIQTILDTIKSNKEVESCDKMLLKLREQRNNSVQTQHQYMFVHQVMLNYFMEWNFLDSSAKRHFDRFTKEYVYAPGTEKELYEIFNYLPDSSSNNDVTLCADNEVYFSDPVSTAHSNSEEDGLSDGSVSTCSTQGDCSFFCYNGSTGCEKSQFWKRMLTQLQNRMAELELTAEYYRELTDKNKRLLSKFRDPHHIGRFIAREFPPRCAVRHPLPPINRTSALTPMDVYMTTRLHVGTKPLDLMRVQKNKDLFKKANFWLSNTHSGQSMDWSLAVLDKIKLEFGQTPQLSFRAQKSEDVQKPVNIEKFVKCPSNVSACCLDSLKHLLIDEITKDLLDQF